MVSETQFVPTVFGFKIHGKYGSSERPEKGGEKKGGELGKEFGEDKSLTKTSVSRPKRKNNKKNR